MLKGGENMVSLTSKSNTFFVSPTDGLQQNKPLLRSPVQPKHDSLFSCPASSLKYLQGAQDIYTINQGLILHRSYKQRFPKSQILCFEIPWYVLDNKPSLRRNLENPQTKTKNMTSSFWYRQGWR